MKKANTQAQVVISTITQGEIIGEFEGRPYYTYNKEAHTTRSFFGNNKKALKAQVDEFLNLEWVKALTDGYITGTQMETEVYYS
jgi:hypothetical protein